MKIQPRSLACLSESEMRAIVDYALGILDQVGMRIESEPMCRHLADAGVTWDGADRLLFPRRLVEEHLAAERRPPGTPPEPAWKSEGGISGYPLRYVDPHDLQVKRHTAATVADLTRLADYLPTIDGIGSVGVPHDIPPLLRPLWMRFLTWRYAAQTLSNSYVIWDVRLCPHILELVSAIAEMEPAGGGMGRYLRASNYLISPLTYSRAEAEQFVWFWQRGHRCTIGNLPSIGGSTPVTLAGAVGMSLAEAIALSILHKAFYGDRGLYLAAGMAPLDMRSGYMPYGRPEEILCALAASQICDYLGTHDAGRVGHGTAAKVADLECGLNKGLTAGLRLALLGDISWSFGLHSTDEIVDPRLVVVESEFVESLRRLRRGFEVNADTLPLEVVQEVGPGGDFLSHPHTLRHFRQELWTPELFSGISYEHWAAAGKETVLDKARRKVLEILETHHPRGMTPRTEQRLLEIIDRAAAALGVEGYRRPALPD